MFLTILSSNQDLGLDGNRQRRILAQQKLIALNTHKLLCNLHYRHKLLCFISTLPPQTVVFYFYITATNCCVLFLHYRHKLLCFISTLQPQTVVFYFYITATNCCVFLYISATTYVFYASPLQICMFSKPQTSVIFVHRSDESVFCREDGVHARGACRGDAAPHGAESSPHPPHEDRPTEPRHVSSTHRLRHEHHAAAHHQTGRYNV